MKKTVLVSNFELNFNSFFTAFFAVLFFLLLFTGISGLAAEEITSDVPYYTEGTAVTGDAAYAQERCRLDVYKPVSCAENAPVVIWFHGGGLSGGNRHIPAEFREQKFLVVPVNYRLFPRASCRDAVYDAAAAVAWTLRNIEKYGGDPKKVYVSGHSAGGYLAAMTALDPQYMAKFGFSNMNIAAALPVSGQMTTHFQVVGERKDPKKTSRANNPLEIDEMAPLFYTTQPVPEIHLLVGDPKLEWPGRVEENYLLAAMLRTVKNHNPVEIQSYSGTNHGTVAKPACEYIRDYVNAKTEN